MEQQQPKDAAACELQPPPRTATSQQDAGHAGAVDLTVPMRHYLQRIPTRHLLLALRQAGQASGTPWTSYPFQEQVVIQMLRHPVAAAHPPGAQYTRAFLQQYLEQLEAGGAGDVHDALLELMAESLGRGEGDGGGACHESFPVPGGGFVTCRVVHRDNEVGLRCWEAGLLLAEYCALAPPRLHGRIVIELGAGTGISGLVCAAAANAAASAAAAAAPPPAPSAACRKANGAAAAARRATGAGEPLCDLCGGGGNCVTAGATAPAAVVLTDGQPRVLANLRLNAEINAPHATAAAVCPVVVEPLAWEDAAAGLDAAVAAAAAAISAAQAGGATAGCCGCGRGTAAPAGPQPPPAAAADTVGGSGGGGGGGCLDIALVGADVVYDVAAVPALVGVVRAVRARWPRCACLFFSTLRDARTLGAFESALRAAGVGRVVDATEGVVAAIGEPLYWLPNRGAVRVTEVLVEGGEGGMLE